GAFTGLRVGIATMQGLAFAHGRPLIGVSALDALVHAVPERTAGLYAAWMDAARQEVFSALYEAAADGTIVMLDEPAVGAPDATLSRWQPLIGGRPLAFVGSGAVRYADRIAAAAGDRAQVVRPTPMIAVALGRLGLERAADGKAGPPHAIRPLYVRRPDAELARERRVEELADRG
ncbi:MAG TPA: tRNA (adenosine(37)-N6)-threonylcarbamoyltransferase complex dimerization subunit type 1 TsaB, partial [Vicinamibacterales bacterium]|nr:tRNA (adenosine(37)-N6)-threonylcarbamoyltransferase complex dimerization subunit type 1 TsaB [Vicinamibacterales bacterium]